MTKIAIGLAALCGVVFLFFCPCLNDRTALADGVGLGERVPELELLTVAGETLRLADLRGDEGSLVVLASWSFKCPAGRPYLDYHAELADWCAERDVAYVAVAMYGEGREQISAFAESQEVQFRLAVDDDCAVADALDTRVVNTIYVLDSQGNLRFAGAPPKSGAVDLVRQAVEELKKGEEVSQPTSRPFG